MEGSRIAGGQAVQSGGGGVLCITTWQGKRYRIPDTRINEQGSGGTSLAAGVYPRTDCQTGCGGEDHCLGLAAAGLDGRTKIL